MTHVSSILVVGAGQAAAVAVAALRDQGYQGQITVIGNEAHAPYERPPLSKAVLASVQADEPVIAIKEADFFIARNVDLRLGLEATSLDASKRQATLSDGSVLQYDRCLIATGGNARVLAGLPASSAHIHYLRTLDDARALRTKLAKCRHAVIIGGGFLGLEIASTARALGIKVSVIETAGRVLARAVPQAFSSWLQTRATRSGATLYMGQSITAINIPENAEAFASILLADGTELNADAIIVAVGLTPNTSLAQHANLHIDPANGGISVDNLCRTSDPHIYAAGDCTSQSRPGYPGTLRLESWQNANEQARVAASAMLDQDTAAPAYPWFWTDQFDCNVQMLGLPQPDLVYVTRGNADPDNPAPKFVMLGLRDGTPYHALAVNAAGDLRALRPLLERSLPIDSSRFADESITLREFAKATVAAAAPTVP